jgi:hypothetical protein
MAAQAARAEMDDEDYEDEEEYAGGGSNFLMFTAVPSWLVSMLFHIVVLLLAAFLTFAVDTDAFRNVVTVQEEPPAEEIEEFEEEEMEEIDVNTEIVSDIMPQPDTENIADEPINIEANDPDAAAISVELDPLGEWTAPRNDLLREIGSYYGTGLSGRGAAARSAMVRAGGGNAASEAAVAAALKWFAAHQFPDGSWNFNHTRGPCQGRCPNPGELNEAPRAATAMALLPFLGAGQTHMEGQYRATVKNGLNFLVRNMKVRGGTGSLEEPGGRMYAHGLGAIVLCEAYAMTRDKGLLQPAQLSLNHISYAQDPVGGGWRYAPKQPGDTSVVGWQLMALKSGHMAYLNVDPATVRGSIKYLDGVQANSGAHYGYTGPAVGRDATTAIGLLCRMYLGWKHDHPALQEGVNWISNKGPSKTGMYYNYYATQVMRHYEGEKWKKWNLSMRDHLINTQAKEGHATGSWHFSGGDHGSGRGGRTYCTSMATMILEVYYRHMPIYRKQAAQDEFPL